MRYLMTIQYDGTAFHGWQVQNNAVTVQQTVQDALERVMGIRPNITGCSRTDSGVHALHFCFHFNYDGQIPANKLVLAVNANLPKSIAATDCKAVPPDFHARYSVKSKQYIYKIYNGLVRNPFYEKYAYHVNIPLDSDLMNDAAQHFLGKHDFSSFCASGSSVESFERTVFSANVERNGDMITFSVEADGFLYNMVRIMTGTLLFVSYGKISVSDIPDIIASKCRDNAGITVPPQGLYLNNVNYESNFEA